MKAILLFALLVGLGMVTAATTHAVDEQRRAYDKMVEETVKEAANLQVYEEEKQTSPGIWFRSRPIEKQ